MATSWKRSSAPADSPAARKKRIEELEPTNICIYWLNNPAFDPKRVLLRRLFFINEYRTKYVSVDFYPARDYLTLFDFVDFVSLKPSSSVMSKLTQWQRPCPRYGKTCVVAKLVVKVARVVPYGWM